MKQKSILMAFCLCAGTVGVPAFAANGSVEQCDSATSVTKINIVEDETKVADIDESEACKTSIWEGTNDLNKEQVKEKIIIEKPMRPEPKPEPEKIFTAVEQKAQYPGGEAELMRWLGENIQYPAMAQKEGIQGRIVVQFVVEKDGSVGHVKIARGKHPALDAEAIRVTKSIDRKFIPAKQNGNIVRSWFTLPINFKLQEESSEQPTEQPAK